MNNNVTILTADKQSGKTTFLTLWSKARKDVGGILTPVLNGERHFYNITDGSDFLMEASADEDFFSVGNYRFSVGAFEKASALLVEKSNDPQIKTLVIDEIGPLEIQQKRGLYDVFCKLLNQQREHALLIVVRPSLVDKVLDMLKSSDKQVKVIHLNEINKPQGGN